MKVKCTIIPPFFSKSPSIQQTKKTMEQEAKNVKDPEESIELCKKRRNEDAPSSLVKRLKTKSRKPKVDPQYVLTQPQKRCLAHSKNDKPPSKRFREVVDAFTNILTRTLEAEKSRPNIHYFFSSNIFTADRDNKPGDLDRLLSQNMKYSNKYQYNYFPILSSKSTEMMVGHHWTLLRFDTLYGVWTHYNSLRGRSDRQDIYFTDALLLKNTVEIYFNKNNDIASGETQTLLLADENCPQQLPKTLDCGAMICYYMQELAAGRMLDGKISRDKIKRFRAQMATSIMNDPGFSRQLDEI